VNRKVHAGFGPADGGSTLRKLAASTPSDWYVCAFQYQEEAQRFYRALGKRLAKFGLEVAAAKTRVIPFHRNPRSGKSRFDFLGFEFYWGEDRGGRPHLKRRTSRKKLRASINRFATWCKENRNLRLKMLFPRLNAKLRGYYNYYGVVGNYASLNQFYWQSMRVLFKWLNRRSQRRSFNWQGFSDLLLHFRVEQPRIVGRPETRMVASLV
jgi:RNA-directed DNA polymerase